MDAVQRPPASEQASGTRLMPLGVTTTLVNAILSSATPASRISPLPRVAGIAVVEEKAAVGGDVGRGFARGKTGVVAGESGYMCSLSMFRFRKQEGSAAPSASPGRIVRILLSWRALWREEGLGCLE